MRHFAASISVINDNYKGQKVGLPPCQSASFPAPESRWRRESTLPRRFIWVSELQWASVTGRSESLTFCTQHKLPVPQERVLPRPPTAQLLKRELAFRSLKEPPPPPPCPNIPQVFVGVIPAGPHLCAGGSILSRSPFGQCGSKAKANSMHFLGLFAQSKSYSKPILLSPQCSCLRLWKWSPCTLEGECKGTGFLQSMIQKARNKCCLLFEVILSTPAEPWQEISSIQK